MKTAGLVREKADPGDARRVTTPFPRPAFIFGLLINERVTIVGEKTGGGGNFGGTVSLTGGFDVWLPVGTAFNPATGKGWESEGIWPHLPMAAEKALEGAHAAALRKLGREGLLERDRETRS
jgi:C-terminal processing protease CtpA/Prc